MVQTSNSGHQLLLLPAKRCPIFASWTTQAPALERFWTDAAGPAAADAAGGPEMRRTAAAAAGRGTNPDLQLAAAALAGLDTQYFGLSPTSAASAGLVTPQSLSSAGSPREAPPFLAPLLPSCQRLMPFARGAAGLGGGAAAAAVGSGRSAMTYEGSVESFPTGSTVTIRGLSVPEHSERAAASLSFLSLHLRDCPKHSRFCRPV